jgi:hypothetical protein
MSKSFTHPFTLSLSLPHSSSFPSPPPFHSVSAPASCITRGPATFQRTFVPSSSVWSSGGGCFVGGSPHPTLADLFLACEVLLPLTVAQDDCFAKLPRFATLHLERVCQAVPEIELLARGVRRHSPTHTGTRASRQAGG